MIIVYEYDPLPICGCVFLCGLCVFLYGIYDHIYLSRDRRMKAYIEEFVLPLLDEGSSTHEFMRLKQTRTEISNGMDKIKSKEIKIGVLNRGEATFVAVFYIGRHGQVIGTRCLAIDLNMEI